MENLSQEEIELLLNGMLDVDTLPKESPSEEAKEVKPEQSLEKVEDNSVKEEIQPEETVAQEELQEPIEPEEPQKEEFDLGQIDKDLKSMMSEIEQEVKENKHLFEPDKMEPEVIPDRKTENALEALDLDKLVETEEEKGKFRLFKKKKKYAASTTMEGYPKPKKEKSSFVKNIEKLPSKPFSLALKVLLGLVIVMGILLGFQFNKQIKAEQAGKIIVSAPTYKANTTNFIFINEKRVFESDALELVKILLDNAYTVVHFDRELNFYANAVELEDNMGNTYKRDLAFADTNTAGISSVARFEPLKEGVSEFTVSVWDNTTNSELIYRIDIKNDIELIQAKYLQQPQKTSLCNRDMGLILENAVFSLAGSTVEYSLMGYDSGMGVQVGWDDTLAENCVSISENTGDTVLEREYPLYYSFENQKAFLGRMDFSHVKNLNSTVDILFENLYRVKDFKARRVPLDDISYNEYGKDVEGKSVKFANYILELERFGEFDDTYVLVYHGEEEVAPKETSRVEMKVEAELVISDATRTGMEISIPCVCMSKLEGGQLVFKNTVLKELTDKFITKQFALRLSVVGVRLPDQKITLDLTKLSNEPINDERAEVSNILIQAFEKRLEYKSGKADLSELKEYFEENILTDGYVAEQYSTSEIHQAAEYYTQVIALGKNNDGSYNAVLKDAWKGNAEDGGLQFYKTHKVIIKKTGGKWFVVEDIFDRGITSNFIY